MIVYYRGPPVCLREGGALFTNQAPTLITSKLAEGFALTKHAGIVGATRDDRLPFCFKPLWQSERESARVLLKLDTDRIYTFPLESSQIISASASSRAGKVSEASSFSAELQA